MRRLVDRYESMHGLDDGAILRPAERGMSTDPASDMHARGDKPIEQAGTISA